MKFSSASFVKLALFMFGETKKYNLSSYCYSGYFAVGSGLSKRLSAA